MIHRKPLIPQLKTAAVHRKRARFSDTDEDHCRVGDHGLFGRSDTASRSARDGGRGLFSDSEDTTQSPSVCSIAETARLPLVRSGEPMRYREIRPRGHSGSKPVDGPKSNRPDNGVADCRIKHGVEVESKEEYDSSKMECETRHMQDRSGLNKEISTKTKQCKDINAAGRPRLSAKKKMTHPNGAAAKISARYLLRR